MTKVKVFTMKNTTFISLLNSKNKEFIKDK